MQWFYRGLHFVTLAPLLLNNALFIITLSWMKPFYPASAKPVLLVLLCLASVFTRAQSKIPPQTLIIPKTSINQATQVCGTDLLLTEWRKNPAYRAREEAMNGQILVASRAMADTSFLLPVVFHIINPNP